MKLTVRCCQQKHLPLQPLFERIAEQRPRWDSASELKGDHLVVRRGHSKENLIVSAEQNRPAALAPAQKTSDC